MTQFFRLAEKEQLIHKYQQQFLVERLLDIDFFLDFIDSAAAISEFSVQNIGRRTVSIVDDSINCIFEPDNPDIVII